MVSCCYRYLFFIFQANYSLGDFSFLANLPVGKSVLGGLSLGDLGSWRIRVLGEIVLGGLSLGKLGLLANLTWPFCTWRISTWQIGVYPSDRVSLMFLRLNKSFSSKTQLHLLKPSTNIKTFRGFPCLRSLSDKTKRKFLFGTKDAYLTQNATYEAGIHQLTN